MSLIKTEKAVMMQRFFDLRGQSSIASTPEFKFGKVAWGSGYVTTSGGSSTIDNIPDDVSSIIGEFHRTDPVMSYTNGVYTIRCTIEKGDLANDVNAELNTLYVLDSKDNILAVMAIMPVNMNASRGITVEGVITEVVTQS